MITYVQGMRTPYALVKLAEADASVGERIKNAILKMARLEIFKRDNGETIYNLISPQGGAMESWKLNGGRPVRLYRYAVDGELAPCFSHFCFTQYGIEATWKTLPDGRVEYDFYATRDQAEKVVEFIREHSVQ